MLSGVHWKPKSGSIIDFRSQLLKIWQKRSLKNGTPYHKILFPEQLTRLESVFTWSLRGMVVIQRNIFRQKSKTFIGFNYWFIVVREKSSILYICFFFNCLLCIKTWISLGPFLVYHRYYLEMELSLGSLLKKENFMAPFYGWGSTASKLEPLRGGSLLFTTKFPEIPGTHFINLGRMKVWVKLGATQLFWTWDPWIGNSVP